MYYADSLSRVYGAPGCGKSFMALDQALSFATGIDWYGSPIQRSRVIYVMAEGQSVNRDRTEAWLSYHDKELADLEDWFWVVPDAVQLTEVGVKDLVKACEEVQPALVFLDTKNAMMVGDENSASDFARMRRALDMIRKASGCCVVLIDHTGYEGTRARGSSAATAGMDTEIRVTMDNEVRPAQITAEVTRDKAAEAGAKWSFRLEPEHPAAVLKPDYELRPTPGLPEWTQAQVNVPERVKAFVGPGKGAITDLARMMAFETSIKRDPSQLGLSLPEAQKILSDHEKTAVRRAWSALKEMGYLISALSKPTELQEGSGKHLWDGPEGVRNV